MGDDVNKLRLREIHKWNGFSETYQQQQQKTKIKQNNRSASNVKNIVNSILKFIYAFTLQWFSLKKIYTSFI